MNQERLMKIILGPVSSEKSNDVAEYNRQFVFKVIKDAKKPEIQRAVEMLFNVEVKSVQVLNTKHKVKRHGQIMGRRSGWKKAYVCLKEGHDINFVTAD